jgi:hypothetical protein
MRTAPGVEHEQIIVAADDDLSTGCERELQILFVLRIAAVGYPHRWFKPDGRPPKNFEEALTSRERDRAREFRAAQNRGNLGIDRRGERDHVYFFRAQ